MDSPTRQTHHLQVIHPSWILCWCLLILHDQHQRIRSVCLRLCQIRLPRLEFQWCHPNHHCRSLWYPRYGFSEVLHQFSKFTTCSDARLCSVWFAVECTWIEWSAEWQCRCKYDHSSGCHYWCISVDALLEQSYDYYCYCNK